MFMGLIFPETVAAITVFTSKSQSLKKDFKRKIIDFYRIILLYIVIAV